MNFILKKQVPPAYEWKVLGTFHATGVMDCIAMVIDKVLPDQYIEFYCTDIEHGFAKFHSEGIEYIIKKSK